MYMLIDGREVNSSDNGLLEVRNPATGEVIDTVPEATRADFDRAIAASREGARVWAATPVHERISVLRRFVALLEENAERIAAILTVENGKPLRQAHDEVAGCARLFRGYSEEALRLYGVTVPGDTQPGLERDLIMVQREPFGVLGAIVPFNFPLDLFTHKVAPALATGNAVVVKPAEDAPLAVLETTRLLLEAGVPGNVMQAVTGSGRNAGRWLAASEHIDLVSFTGSTEAGIEVAQSAARNLNPAFLELGGNDPLIIFPDADLDSAVSNAIQSRTLCNGQVCSATKRLIVHRDVAGELVGSLVERLGSMKVGDPTDPATEIGPLISPAAAERAAGHVATALGQGAKLALGDGTASAAYFAPVVLVDVDRRADIARDTEVFAPVVKVERPNGEDARHHDPFWRGESLYTMLYNRNKYGITLNTRHPRALKILEGLIAWADVVVENYRPGTLEKMGIGYERMREIRPDIILVSISGFGQTGPDSRRALFDAIAQASSGLMSVTGDPDGPPMLTGTYVADYMTGEKAAVGALGALIHRMRTGEGQLVDVASLDTTFSILGTRLIAYLMLGQEMPRNGSRDLLSAPGNVYETADGPMYIQAGTDGLFRRLCQVMGREDLLEREEFKDVRRRMANVDLVEREVAAWAATRTSAEISAALDPVGIPNARVMSIPEVVASPQLKARDMIVDVEHPSLGTLRLPGTPIKMEKSPPAVHKAPPVVGEDNDTVYGRILGFDKEEIRSLRADGVI